MPGETARILTEIDNTECSLDVTNIACTFRKHLTLTFKNGTSHEFVINVNNFSFPGV